MQLDSGFIAFDPVTRPAQASGDLDGLRFAIKDIFALSGCVTGLGQPDWRASHAPAGMDAPVLSALLQAGATLIGKTHTDELCYSIAGQNLHYGTPPNPACPERIPGGSSSGSASVTAAGLVDFALGSDTGGSVRIPASYCGIYGFRPTHGAISLQGVAPLAPRFDTLGWFAPDLARLTQVGQVLLPDAASAFQFTQLRSIAEVRANVAPPLQTQLPSLLDSAAGLSLQPDLSLGNLDRFATLFRVVQGYQAWQVYGAWIEARRPQFGPGIRERFAAAAQISRADYDSALADADRLRDQMRVLLGSNTVWCIPTAPAGAPALDSPSQDVEATRARTMRMNAIAGIAGLPQITLPLLQEGSAPVGLSLIGPAGSDRALLALAAQLQQGWSTTTEQEKIHGT